MARSDDLALALDPLAGQSLAMRRVIDEARKRTYAGMFALKLLDLRPEDGGTQLDVVLPHDLAPFDPVLEQLALEGLVKIDAGKGRYALTDRGDEYLDTLIHEAEGYIDEFDGQPGHLIARSLRARNLDPLRVRFLWGWYQGEFDDPVMFQQRRGVASVETDWAAYLLSDDFYRELADDVA